MRRARRESETTPSVWGPGGGRHRVRAPACPARREDLGRGPLVGQQEPARQARVDQRAPAALGEVALPEWDVPALAAARPIAPLVRVPAEVLAEEPVVVPAVRVDAVAAAVVAVAEPRARSVAVEVPLARSTSLASSAARNSTTCRLRRSAV